ncbi:Uncharacterised protein [Streptococcus pneumoniae]|nr:Uncharacterised protein [Streptococcus pneumoniae]
MMQSGGYIMGGFIPVLAGIARDYFDSYTQVFIIMALLSLILLLLTLVMNKRRRNAEDLLSA